MAAAVGAHSPQMTNLLARYGVPNERSLIRAIREEYAENTGERFTDREASVLLDQMLEAEYQRIAGGAYDEREDDMEQTTTTNAIDELPMGDPREDPRLDDPKFIGTEEGQALVEAAAQADKEARRLAKNAAEKARRDRIKAERNGPEPASDAAIEAVVKSSPDPKAMATMAQAIADDPTQKASTRRAAKVAVKAAAEVAKQKPEAKAKGVVTNRPLKLGDKPIEVKGVKMFPILHRDGAIAGHQTDNYIWRCPTCLRRLRDEYCVGPKGGAAHRRVPAPQGYRAADRIAK